MCWRCIENCIVKNPFLFFFVFDINSFPILYKMTTREYLVATPLKCAYLVSVIYITGNPQLTSRPLVT